VDALIGGWGVSGITTWRSGAPLLISASSSDLLPQNGGQRADYVCPGSANNPRKIGEWFQTSCFAQPTGFRFGNSGVAEGGVFGPRYQNWDIAAYKAWNFGRDGSQQIKFSANFFNVVNHVNYQQPDTNVGDSSFGVISSDFLPRQGMLGLTYQF
jgi:hypothetical protein